MTEMEIGVVEDAIAWFVTTADYKIMFSDVQEKEFRESMNKYPESLKRLVANYWDQYLNYAPDTQEQRL
jgi:hypothetical protein